MQVRNKAKSKTLKALFTPLKICLILAAAVGASSQTSVTQAGVLDNFMSDMYSNTTAGGYFETQQRGVITGGGFVARVGIKSINLVSFDPPRVSAGCGGINLFGGSFSFINSAELVQLLRAIAQNALGLLFQVGLNAISQPLTSLLSVWSTKLQAMNSTLKNSCEAAKKLFTLDTSGQSLSSTIQSSMQTIGEEAGKFSDSFNGTWARIKDNWGALKGGSKSSEQAQTTRDLALKEIPDTGNITWRAINASKSYQAIMPLSGGNEDQAKIFLMNFIGTEVFDQSAETQQDGACKSGSSVSCEPKRSSYGGLITYSDLESPEDNTNFYACNDTEPNGCASNPLPVTKISNFYQGTARLVNKALYGIDSPSLNLDKAMIIANISAGKGIAGKAGKPDLNNTLTQEEKALVITSGSELVNYLAQIKNPDQIMAISERVRRQIIDDLTLQLAKALYKAATMTFDGVAVKVSKPKDYQSTLERWQREIIAHEKNSNSVQFRNDMHLYVQQIKASNVTNTIPVAMTPK